jgi:prepilin-type N-terminal cleavage/methylation domain-containing protein
MARFVLDHFNSSNPAVSTRQEGMTKKGFTLIELSIVLIIIALVVTLSIASNWTGTDGVLTPVQTYSIDKKLDDGNPSIGRLSADKSWQNGNGNCLSGSNYLMSNTKQACIFAWKLD